MPKVVDRVTVLADDFARLRTRFTTDGPKVTGLAVQLEVRQAETWKPVRRCDDHHGQPHVDHYNYRGEQIDKVWLDLDRNEALTWIIADIKANWEHYAAEFLER